MAVCLEFLNDIVAQLWPNINVAGSKMTMDIANPMFKTMLPGPLASLHFTKVDLGPIPMTVSKVLATKTDTNGIKLDLNVDWKGKADIELKGNMIPTLGVESVELHGRLSVLLAPLTNVIPLIGAAQVAFINPPVLSLDFTGAANIADFSVINGSVRKVILNIINSILTLPNRILVNLDVNNDYFQTYLYPLGIIRVTVDKAFNFAEESKGKASKFFSKLTRSAPDCYTEVTVGAEPEWKTKVKPNTTHPVWDETHDFVVTDYDQVIKLTVMDRDIGADAEVGLAVLTVREALMAGSAQDLSLVKKGVESEGRLSVSTQYFPFSPISDSFSIADHRAEGLICGLATILIAGAFGIKGPRETLKPSVVVKWGPKHHFQTGIQTDAAGVDISNPAFNQNFRIPVTAEMVGGGGGEVAPFRIALMNGEKEVGGVDVPFAEVVGAPMMTLASRFEVGEGTTVRACICLRGIGSASA
ncbi:hypothetical protein LTR91_023257 [Friedmanniomyces endolithicus]|uniref:C2 domain-containing protein n=1 Tax=Friedmanniomyces endolithicus TaxID=329885 RepID=A0AAN6JYI1_9PEZI|nr:hypothetical protein LTR94_004042 [Friedmanniomyces endolithicus]KAK0775230.1 hypothetical protein LTR38_015934 [Friedmanniomyces endolithicus]KAK0776222.1 hypothetical protein LTR75_016335 [Friedmanniomyces endolithicus]KAK0789419.1 hypothetical protein LTR59_009662 [Friedmanniomyces endolithicus]KAK0847846.1 hypothetical protein LTS02_014295 [Friedmanniomyces endolithicus]